MTDKKGLMQDAPTRKMISIIPKSQIKMWQIYNILFTNAKK